MKSFILSPWTDLNAVDLVVRQVLEARMELGNKEDKKKKTNNLLLLFNFLKIHFSPEPSF